MPIANVDTGNVSLGKPKTGGAVFRAPKGTALPTSATAALSNDFTSMGYISEDGVVNANSPESEVIRAWGGDVVMAYQNDREDTFRMTMIEASRIAVLESVYGEDNVSGTDLASGISVSANAADLGEYVYVIDTLLHDNVPHRTVIPCGKVTELGDVNYSDSSVVGYEVTITAIADSSGNTHYEYFGGGGS